jgi:simple sugar transport system ATP-binding protein
MSTPMVEMTNIVKRWGAVSALAGVDFKVNPGEVVALLGDNGAGKSTLIKILSGVERATSGSIKITGEEVQLHSTRDAIDRRIETIFQDSALVEQLSIGRNLFLGREPTRRVGPFKALDKKYMTSASGDLLKRVGISKNLDPKTPIAALSGGERQSIAIARAMFFKSDLIILDEPTNNLGLEETRGVLRFLRDIKAAGQASVLITHNLHHVFDVADRAVVLRRGQVVGDLPVSETNVDHLSDLITGEVEHHGQMPPH